MILFTIALPIEAKIIKKEIKYLKLKGIKIDFLLTGVGVLNTIYQIKDYIDKNGKPDFIVNIGVCGKKDDSKNDFFQVYRIKNLANKKEALCPIYIKNLPLKSLACSDKIITDPSEIGDENFVDMESFGIDYICDKEKIPYIIIKKPFDSISKVSLQVNKNDLELCLIGLDYKNLLSQIQFFLSKNQKEIFSKKGEEIKNKFQLTFTQTEMLKKYINKKIAFGENKIQILEGLLTTGKKELLENLNK